MSSPVSVIGLSRQLRTLLILDPRGAPGFALLLHNEGECNHGDNTSLDPV